MPLKTEPDLGINSWLEDELYQQYLNDRTAVDESWKHVFEDAPNGHPEVAPSPAPPLARSAPPPTAPENLQPLRGIAAKIAENMNASVTIPLATSQRVIPVKVMDENRRIINQHRTLVGKSKVSYTHLIGWAILKALEDFPGLNHAYGEANGQPARIVHPQINLVSRWTWRPKTADATCWSPTSRTPARWISRNTSPLSTTWWTAPAKASWRPRISRTRRFR